MPTEKEHSRTVFLSEKSNLSPSFFYAYRHLRSCHLTFEHTGKHGKWATVVHKILAQSFTALKNFEQMDSH